MDLVSRSNLRFPRISVPLSSDTTSTVSVNGSSSPARFGFPFPATQFRRPPKLSFEIHAKKKKSSTAPPVSAPRPNIVEELLDDEDEDEEDQVLLDDFDEELQMEDDEDDEFYIEDEAELYMGDGGGGGGIKLAGTWWDKEAITIAEAVCESFDGDLGIYAFKTLSNSTIQVRIERLTTK